MELQFHPARAPNARLRRSAFAFRRIVRPWLETGSFVRRPGALVHFRRRTTTQPLVRSVFVVPYDIGSQLTPEIGQTHRHQNPSQVFGLHRADESLNDRQAAVFAHSTKARTNPASFAPPFESGTPKLTALVRDDVFGGPAGCFGRATEKRSHVSGARRPFEDRKSHRLAREMINDERYPPAERPDLRQGKRQPRAPESGAGRNGCEVEMPNMIRVSGRDHANGQLVGYGLCTFSGQRFRRLRVWVQVFGRQNDGATPSGLPSRRR